MQNLKDIRKRIASVKSTKQITQAMKMVAAAKLRKVQNRIIQLRPYTYKLKSLLEVIIANLEGELNNPLFRQRELKKVLLIVISANRGLCGAFNTNVARKAELVINEYTQQGINVDIFAIGKKASFYFSRHGYNVIKENNSAIEIVEFEKAKILAQEMIDSFVSGKYDRIDIVYNSFKTPGSQLIIHEQFLPIEKPEGEPNLDFIFEPDLQTIIDRLVLGYLLFAEFFYYLLDSYAAEQGARMTAMHKATDNAQEMIRQLTLEYNKARQAAITKEIIEIVSGAEALKGL